MHIAVFTKRTTFHKGYGGLETQNKVLVEGLSERGHTVVVFSPKEDVQVESESLNGVEYVFIDSVYRMGIFFQGVEDKVADMVTKFTPAESVEGVFSSKGKEDWIEKSVQSFENYHDVNKFDIVLCQSAVGLGIIREKSRLNVPVISISHGTILGEYKTSLKDTPNRKFFNPKFFLKTTRNTIYVLVNFFTRQREFILHSNQIVAVSNAVKNSLIDETYIPENKVTVIHNGVDDNDFAPEPDTIENTPVITYLGRVIRSKGVFVLADSLKDITLDYKFNIVGDGDDLDELKDYVKDLGIDDKTTFFGNIPHSEVRKKLSETSIFVLPSLRHEGFPMVIVEAMLMGLPVVAADIGGNSDAIEHERTGLLVKSGDTLDLHRSLVKLIEDKELRTSMGINARIKAENEFSLSVMLDKYENLIERIINENS